MFLWLLQVMYDNKGRLSCTAEGSPQELFERIVTISDAKNVAPRTSSRSRKNDDFDLCVDNELGFAKDRTISRYDDPLASVSFFLFGFF
jgi:protein AFG1